MPLTDNLKPSFTEGIANIGEASIHYRHAPGGIRTIVFLHSLGCDLETWSRVAPLYSPEFSTLTYDLRGHGQSQASSDVQSIDDYVFDLIELLDDLKIEEATLIGVSLGGLIALAAAISHPERFNRLVVIAASARIGTYDAWDQRIQAIKTASLANLAETLVPRWFSREFIDANPNAYQSYLAKLKNNSEAAYCASCAVLRDTNLYRQLRQLNIPCLIIGGALDEAVPLDELQKLSKSIPDCRLECIEKAAHLPPIETPDSVFDISLRFLKQSSNA